MQAHGMCMQTYRRADVHTRTAGIKRPSLSNLGILARKKKTRATAPAPGLPCTLGRAGVASYP